MKTTVGPIAVCWLRRDLRLHDQAALYHALDSGLPVLCLFVFDRTILRKLADLHDRRLTFIHDVLAGIKVGLAGYGSDLYVAHDTPRAAWEALLDTYDVQAVYTNEDYEPYAIHRDTEIRAFLESRSVRFHTYKDQVIFGPQDVLKADGKPYTVYTPFSNKWMAQFNSDCLKPYDIKPLTKGFLKVNPLIFPSLEELGFVRNEFPVPPDQAPDGLLRNYAETRDFPASENGTSRLGIHLRFGTVSVRETVARAAAQSQTFLKELIWREFFMQILYHFPETESRCFRKEYENIRWRNNETEFEKWCRGETGYPLVDAGMRELNATGFMHNRVRMVVASFLAKHLLIDWRWGERYFAEKLLDFDLSANVGNWQWAAGCGCDAAPYFRVFNPQAQAQKFDAGGEYIRRWVPEWEAFGYPAPMVDHAFARERALRTYAEGIKAKD